MSSTIDERKVHQIASELLRSGSKVTVSLVADALDIPLSDELQTELDRWWMDVEAKVSFSQNIRREGKHPEVPDTVYQSVQLIWNNALNDARHSLEEIMREEHNIQKANQTSAESEIHLVKAQVEYLESENTILRTQIKEKEDTIKNFTAEQAMLKTSLQAAEYNVGELERKNASLKVDAEQANERKNEAKKLLDQRMKQEITRHQEANSVLENKLKYYRVQLDKVRDEWNKKETALNTQVQEYKTKIAHNDVVMDAQKRQIRAQDEELHRFHGEMVNQSRNVSSTSSQVLSKSNFIKRLEDEIQQNELMLKELKQRAHLEKSDYKRRETDLHKLLKEREAELNVNTAKVNELQRLLIAREEEVRRLTTRL